MTGGIFFEEFEVSTEKYIGQPSDSHRQIAPLAYIKGCIPLRCLSELVRCFHTHFTMFREPLILSISQSERKVNGRKRKKWFVVFVLVRSGRFVLQKSRAQSVVGHGF